MPQVKRQTKKQKQWAVITSTILEREILRGVFSLIPLPTTKETMTEVIEGIREDEDYERGLSTSWADANCEVEVIRPAGIEVRIVEGSSRHITRFENMPALDSAPILLSILASDKRLTPEYLANLLNTRA